MNWFWDNLLLKKEDRLGMLVFLGILVLLLIGRWVLVVWYTPQFVEFDSSKYNDVEFIDIQKEPLEKNSEVLSTHRIDKPQKFINKSMPIQAAKDPLTHEISLFDFDPNLIGKDSLLLLGLSGYAAANLLKYRSNGGRFNEASDLKRIYGLDEEKYEKLEPHVRIMTTAKEAIEKQTVKPKSKKQKLALGSIDINLADTTDFKSLRGIGSVYANRMVKFRGSLGGYFSIDQINEVWGISDSLYLAIKPYLKIDTSSLQKRNINLQSKESLAKHPYIDWKKAKTITKYRKMHGDFSSIDELYKLHGLDDAFVDTLSQYFTVQ